MFTDYVASHVVLYSQASLSRDSIRDLLYVTILAELDISIHCQDMTANELRGMFAIDDSLVTWVHTPSNAVARYIRISLRQPERLAALCFRQSRSFAILSLMIISYRCLSLIIRICQSEAHYPNTKRIRSSGGTSSNMPLFRKIGVQISL